MKQTRGQMKNSVSPVVVRFRSAAAQAAPNRSEKVNEVSVKSAGTLLRQAKATSAEAAELIR